MQRPYSNLAPFFEIQVDVEALNYQVEERELRKAIERSDDMAYDKLRLGQNKGINERVGWSWAILPLNRAWGSGSVKTSQMRNRDQVDWALFWVVFMSLSITPRYQACTL